MAGEMIGIGVIGVGLMGRRHAENLVHSVPEARLVAVADANGALAGRVALELAVSQCTVDDLLAREDVRAVVIASPAATHDALAVAAVRAGKDVLVEKPIALTLEGADRAIAAAREASARLQIGFQRRYDGATLEAHRLLRSGALGEPLLFKAVARDRVAPRGTPGSLARSDILTESAIHDLDLARWLVGDEVRAVRAMVATVGDPSAAPAPNAALVELRFAHGALGSVETYRGAGYAYDIREEVVCAEGTVIVGGFAQSTLTVLRPGGHSDLAAGFLERFADAYVAEVRDFVRGALERRPPAVTAEDGRRALAIALAADVAAAEEREVSVTA